ncbi:MAG: hypothetical protein ACYSWU_06680 [Planctomycetota bacterium]|jgi:hypothetical protein
MLIPQYTLRRLLAVAAVCCVVVFPIFAMAVQEYRAGYMAMQEFRPGFMPVQEFQAGNRGSCWATGVSIAILSLVVVLLVHSLLFALLWAFSVVFSLLFPRPAGLGRSPFVHDSASLRPKGPGAADDKDIPASPIILE